MYFLLQLNGGGRSYCNLHWRLWVDVLTYRLTVREVKWGENESISSMRVTSCWSEAWLKLSLNHPTLADQQKHPIMTNTRINNNKKGEHAWMKLKMK
jgi:hypothetical protein